MLLEGKILERKMLERKMLERRILDGNELRRATRMMLAAAEEAVYSGCGESKRGVVFERENRIVSRGHNAPPPGYICAPQACGRVCGDWTIHAEVNAILDAANHSKNILDTRGYHVKIKDDKMIPADGPSCFRCAGIMYQAGVKDFVLLEREGSDIVYAMYPIRLFAQLSFRNDKRLTIDADAIRMLDMHAKR